MLRAIILSLALLIGLGTIIPLATNFAEAGHKDLSLYEKKSKPKITKFSKKWWVGYNKRKLRIKETAKVKKRFGLQTKIKLAANPAVSAANPSVETSSYSKKIVRKKRAAESKKLATKRKSIRKKRLARKKKFAAKRKYTARKRTNSTKYSKKSGSYKKARYAKSRKNPRYTKKRIIRKSSGARIIPAASNSYYKPIQPAPTASFFQPVVLPTGGIAPRTWMTGEITPSEMIFNVSDTNGLNLGSASISVVGPAKEPVKIINNRIKMIGGITTASLRRTVIDQMIEEGGWITNDYQKEIDGKKVYVVEAKSPGEKGQMNSRLFYFTEVDGEIYNVATNSEEKSVELLAVETEKVINSLQTKTDEAEQIKTLENSNAIAANFANVFVNH